MADVKDAASFLETYGGLTSQAAASLAGYVAAAGTAEAIDVLVGETRAATTAPDARALRLLYICRAANRMLSHTEVELIFRLTSSSAVATVRRMQALYPKEVDAFLTEMVKSADVFKTGVAGDPRYQLVFGEAVAFDQAQRMLDRKGGTLDVRADRRTLTIEVPATMKDKNSAVYDPRKLLGITANPRPLPTQ